MTTYARRIAILAEGHLDFHHGKTAMSLLRYRPEEVVAVIDSQHAGRTTSDVLALGGEIPIVADVEEAFRLDRSINTLLIGIAPRGGGLPERWRPQLLQSIQRGIDVVSGLHYMLRDDAEFVQAATQSGSRLIDVRQPPSALSVAELRPRRRSHVVTFVGSDCAVGKMTAALEVTSAARASGLSAAFVATGQTGIMLEGTGIAIDRVIGDFMAGAAEQLVVEACEHADWVFVEGQGSLLHPGYSGVTLALLHGSSPDALVLVHKPDLTHIEEYPLPIPPLPRLVEIYEEAAAWIKPAKVAAVALNTRALNREETDHAIAEAEALTGLPATDPVKFGGHKLINALVDVLVGQAA